MDCYFELCCEESWFIKMIWLIYIHMWDNGSVSPLIRIGQNIPAMFPYWQRIIHIYLFSSETYCLNIIEMTLKIGKTFNDMGIYW